MIRLTVSTPTPLAVAISILDQEGSLSAHELPAARRAVRAVATAPAYTTPMGTSLVLMSDADIDRMVKIAAGLLAEASVMRAAASRRMSGDRSHAAYSMAGALKSAADLARHMRMLRA